MSQTFNLDACTLLRLLAVRFTTIVKYDIPTYRIQLQNRARTEYLNRPS